MSVSSTNDQESHEHKWIPLYRRLGGAQHFYVQLNPVFSTWHTH